jgi:hypothetical protein
MNDSQRKFLAGFLAVLCALALIAVLLLTSVEHNAFKMKFYRAEYAKLNSAEVYGISSRNNADHRGAACLYQGSG